MKNLYIIGARGFGREVFVLLKNSIESKYGNIKPVGFLDDKKDALAGYTDYLPIVDSAENYQPQEDDVFVCAMGTPQTKKKYVDIIKAKGGVFINLIHENAEISSDYSQCEGLLVFSNSVVSVDVKLGNFVSIQSFSFVGHDANIGDWCHLNGFSSINGFVELQSGVQIYTHATVLPKFQIGENAIVGAGSMVMKNVNANTTVFGNPARELKVN